MPAGRILAAPAGLLPVRGGSFSSMDFMIRPSAGVSIWCYGHCMSVLPLSLSMMIGADGYDDGGGGGGGNDDVDECCCRWRCCC